MNGNKFTTNQILEKKNGRSCEGADFSWWSSIVSRTLLKLIRVTDNFPTPKRRLSIRRKVNPTSHGSREGPRSEALRSSPRIATSRFEMQQLQGAISEGVAHYAYYYDVLAN